MFRASPRSTVELLGCMTMRAKPSSIRHLSGAAIFLLAGVIIPNDGCAVEIKTGVDKLSVRLDNTVKASAAFRVEGKDDRILSDPNKDDGDRNFDQGLVSTRLDILSELDFIYDRSYGVRLSAAAWYDPQHIGGNDHDSPRTANQRSSDFDRFTDGTEEIHGLNAELLDAFAFANFEKLGVPVTVRVGRHTIYWGESVLLAGAVNGVAMGQSPIDAAKGSQVPGAEAKELFRPVGQVSADFRPTPNLTLAGFFGFEWEKWRLSSAGSYLGNSDVLGKGGEAFIAGFDPGLGVLRIDREDDLEADDLGQWGVSVRYYVKTVDATFGAYFLNYHEKLPAVATTPGILPVAPADCPAVGGTVDATFGCINPAVIDLASGKVGELRFVYPEDTRVAAVSAATEVAGISVSSELGYRWNQPMAIKDGFVTLLPGQSVSGAAAMAPRGQSLHLTANAIGILSGNAIWDTASWLVEGSWNHLVKVTQARENFDDANRDRDAFVVGFGFKPTWLRVFPQIDLSLNISGGWSVVGDSALGTTYGSDGTGSYRIALEADIRQRTRIELAYVDFFGDPSDGGVNGDLNDRGFITLSVKTSF